MLCVDCADIHARNLRNLRDDTEHASQRYDNHLLASTLHLSDSSTVLGDGEDDNEAAWLERLERLRFELADGVERQAQQRQSDLARLESKLCVLSSITFTLCDSQHGWRRQNAQMRQLAVDTDGDALLNQLYDQTCQWRQQFHRTRLLNDLFHIWHDGPFGTINGAPALGRRALIDAMQGCVWDVWLISLPYARWRLIVNRNDQRFRGMKLTLRGDLSSCWCTYWRSVSA
jgi:beclin 1